MSTIASGDDGQTIGAFCEELKAAPGQVIRRGGMVFTYRGEVDLKDWPQVLSKVEEMETDVQE